MNETKSWYASKTVWASIAVLLITMLQILHFTLDATAQSDLTNWIELAGQVIAGGVTLFGRLAATKRISSSSQSSSSLYVLLGCLLTLGAATGCAPDAVGVQADAQRYRAMQPVVAEYQTNHPEQSQTWADFMRSWERAISAKQSRTPATQPTAY